MRFTSFVHKPISYNIFFLFILMSLCSFSSVPTSQSKEAYPPIKKQTLTQKSREKRLNKRYNRLHERFDQAKNSKKRLRLQQKIRQVERQQDKPGTPIFGVLGLGFGILAFICFFGGGFLFSVAFLAVGILLAIAGLVLSILSLVFHKKDPKRYTLKGLGIAGIIVCSIMILFLLGMSFSISF